MILESAATTTYGNWIFVRFTKLAKLMSGYAIICDNCCERSLKGNRSAFFLFLFFDSFRYLLVTSYGTKNINVLSHVSWELWEVKNERFYIIYLWVELPAT